MAEKPPKVARKATAAKPLRRRPSRARRAEARPAKPVLLSGGNPQIAKGYGDAPVQAYIAAMPGWKSDVGRRLDALIERAVPGVKKAVKWNSPLYGVEDNVWFLGIHVFAKYIKVAFFRGAQLSPGSAGRFQAEGRALFPHPRGRRARRSAVRRLGEAGEPIAGREDVSGKQRGS